MKKLFKANPKLAKNAIFILLIVAIMVVGINVKSAKSNEGINISTAAR